MMKKHEGLSGEEARKILERVGPNRLERKKQYSVFKLFFGQFVSPLIYILVFAGGITFFLGDYVDSVVIGAAVVVNTILGFYQEYKAQRSLEALAAILHPQAMVLRDGQWRVIPVAEVVPGDVAMLKIGDSVPADGVLVYEDGLFCNEAILTGESEPVEKYDYRSTHSTGSGQAKGTKEILRQSGASQATRSAQDDDADLKSVSASSSTEGTSELTRIFDQIQNKHKAFMGTTVTVGEGRMLVVLTGRATAMGNIAGSLAVTQEERTPLQKKVHRFSRVLSLVVLLVVGLIFSLGVLAGDSVTEMFKTAVAIAVAAIPEGLVVSLTVILAIGMQRILKHKALVRKLLAAETLGSVTVICSDKTGTLTEGKMRVTEVITSTKGTRGTKSIESMEGSAKREEMDLLVKAMAITNNHQDPLEVGMWEWLSEQKKKPERMREEVERIDKLPFSPEWRYSATLTTDAVYVVGAPEEVLKKCKVESAKLKMWMKKFQDLGSKGYRLVGFAYRKSQPNERKLSREHVDHNLTWLGMVIYEDPVRENVAESLAAAERAGITVKVITGDYKETAMAILARLGIEVGEKEVVTGDELAQLSEGALRERVGEIKLFARTQPEQKLRIVTALQEQGEVVAMMGDGVNDAPALKKADIGIVVGEASDVARETADMVLLDSNFTTILAAVEEGRGIFDNLRKVILYLLSDAFAEIILVTGSILMRLPLPITAVQILWVNLVDDGLPSLALTFEPKDDDLLKQAPRRTSASFLDKEVSWLIALISTASGGIALVSFWWLLHSGYTVELARSVTFAMLGVSTLLYVFSSRSLRQPIWKEKLTKNPLLLLAVGVGIILQLAALYMPFLQRTLKTQGLGLSEWGIVLGMAMVVISIIEVAKWLFSRNKHLITLLDSTEH